MGGTSRLQGDSLTASDEFVSQQPAYYAEILLEIFLNGERSWWSHNLLQANLQNATFQLSQEGTPLPINFGYNLFNSVGYVFGEYEGTLDLGPLQPGENVEIVYQLSTTVFGPGDTGYGAFGRIGDPFVFGANRFQGFDPAEFSSILFGDDRPRQVIRSTGIIPEPATMSLLGLGLAGIVVKQLRSKKK